MKPAPPEDINHRDPIYGWVVFSSVAEKRTEIRSPMGKTLWQFDAYIGRRQIHLSPDGVKLVLFGSEHFGSTLRTDNQVEILQVVTPGEEPKKIYYDQIFGIPIEKAAKRVKNMIKGGGWVGADHLFSLESIDWDAGEIAFVSVDGRRHGIGI